MAVAVVPPSPTVAVVPDVPRTIEEKARRPPQLEEVPEAEDKALRRRLEMAEAQKLALAAQLADEMASEAIS